jgi:uncharacterized protein (DUF2062 family)
VVFKRRERRSIWQVVTEAVWPRGGWVRAFEYVKHRVRRLPDTPEKIARGIFAGVWTTFTPFFGFHFVVAYLLAKIMRGNILAALLATFFGNPLTYVPIAAVSLETGHFLLGTRPRRGIDISLGEKFAGAWSDLWHNVVSIFTPAQMDWHGLAIFYREVFFPFMIGGIIPGIVAGSVSYYLSVPVIRAYQNSRRKKLRNKLDTLKKKPDTPPDAGPMAG